MLSLLICTVHLDRPFKSIFLSSPFFLFCVQEGEEGELEAGSDKMNAPKIEERVFLLPDEDK